MSKWYGLGAYAEKQRSINPSLPLATIAEMAIKEFNLTLNREQVRKIISRELTTKVVEPTSPVFFNTRQDKFRKPGDYLILGCLHVPGHNKKMVDGITKMMSNHSFQGLMLIGDFLDMNSLSSHNHNQFTAIKGLDLNKEYEAGNSVLDQLTKYLYKDAAKVYIYGNHEDRHSRYMANMQNAKAPVQSPKDALHLDARGFNTFTDWDNDFVKLGNHLELIHGQYYNTHCAKQHIDKFRGSVMFAHTHRIQTYVEGSTGGFNIGWCGDIKSPLFNYAERGTKSQWQNGFAVVTLDEEGEFYVNQVFFHNNKFYYNGKFY